MIGKGNILLTFAAVLLLLGMAAVAYSPVEGLGFNETGRSGLIVGMISAAVAATLGFMARAQRRWAVTAGLILAFALLVMTTHRALLGWQKVADGEPTKWWASLLITLMGVASLIALVALARGFASTRPLPTPER